MNTSNSSFLVKLRHPPSAVELCRQAGAEPVTPDIVLVRDPEQALSNFGGEVDYIVPNDRYHRFQSRPSDKVPSALWGLDNNGQDGGKPDADIDAPEAWKMSTGKDVLVAVLDTGIDTTHPDLLPNMYVNAAEIPGDGLDNDGNGVVDDVHGYNAADQTGNPWSDDPHGSHCAGTIAAKGRVLGVAPDAKILPIKIYDEDDWTDASTIIRALQYAQDAGARIASHSYTGLLYNRAVEEMFAKTDMLHVVAAGNHHSNNDEKKTYPPSYELPNLITVAASDRHDRIADFSNYGPKSVHLAAPGVEILSTTSYGNWGSWNGTSMACPHVAGTGALLASKFPDESPADWKKRILESVDVQPGWEEKVQTGGRLNAYRALGGETAQERATRIDLERLRRTGRSGASG